MPRATLYGQFLPRDEYPNVNGIPTAGGAAYTYGERHINPRMVPRSHFQSRTQTPLRRIPTDATPFRVFPQNMRAGGRITDDHR